MILLATFKFDVVEEEWCCFLNTTKIASEKLRTAIEKAVNRKETPYHMEYEDMKWEGPLAVAVFDPEFPIQLDGIVDIVETPDTTWK